LSAPAPTAAAGPVDASLAAADAGDRISSGFVSSLAEPAGQGQMRDAASNDGWRSQASSMSCTPQPFHPVQINQGSYELTVSELQRLVEMPHLTQLQLGLTHPQQVSASDVAIPGMQPNAGVQYLAGAAGSCRGK
jgi:hypothetical protein